MIKLYRHNTNPIIWMIKTKIIQILTVKTKTAKIINCNSIECLGINLILPILKKLRSIVKMDLHLELMLLKLKIMISFNRKFMFKMAKIF